MAWPDLSRHSFIAAGTYRSAYSYTFRPFILIYLGRESFFRSCEPHMYIKSASSHQSDRTLVDNIPTDRSFTSLYSSVMAPAPSEKIMLSRSCGSRTRDKVSVPMINALFAIPA